MNPRTFTFVGYVSAILFAASAAYWGSAKVASKNLVDAIQQGDQRLVDEAFDWPSVLSSVEKRISTSFADPNATKLGALVSTTFRSSYLTNVQKNGQDFAFQSEGFSNFDEYSIRTQRGNKLVLRRRGAKWLVSDFILTIENARKVSIGELAKYLPDPNYSVHANDIYLGPPSFGCRLTSDLDVMSLAVDPQQKAIAYVRAISLDKETDTPHTQLWKLDLETMTSTLLVDGKEADRPEESTDNQQNLMFSTDSRYLYFTAQAWATSNAIVELDMQTNAMRYVAPGNRLRIVRRGRYENALVTTQHRYRDGGGSYEMTLVIDRTGKELVRADRELATSLELAAFLRAVEARL